MYALDYIDAKDGNMIWASHSGADLSEAPLAGAERIAEQITVLEKKAQEFMRLKKFLIRKFPRRQTECAGGCQITELICHCAGEDGKNALGGKGSLYRNTAGTEGRSSGNLFRLLLCDTAAFCVCQNLFLLLCLPRSNLIGLFPLIMLRIGILPFHGKVNVYEDGDGGTV